MCCELPIQIYLLLNEEGEMVFVVIKLRTFGCIKMYYIKLEARHRYSPLPEVLWTPQAEIPSSYNPDLCDFAIFFSGYYLLVTIQFPKLLESRIVHSICVVYLPND